jgi:DNA-binding NarL/FixJ family response regulator
MKVANMIDVTDLAPRVSCPCLVVNSRDNRRIPLEEGRLLASLLPDARFVALPTANFFVREDEPAWAQFVQELRAFLPALPAHERPFGGLTARERELLEFLARGLDNHQIAAHLDLSEKTVRNHVSAIFAKLGVESRAQAIVRAREAGYGVGSHA